MRMTHTSMAAMHMSTSAIQTASSYTSLDAAAWIAVWTTIIMVLIAPLEMSCCLVCNMDNGSKGAFLENSHSQAMCMKVLLVKDKSSSIHIHTITAS